MLQAVEVSNCELFLFCALYFLALVCSTVYVVNKKGAKGLGVFFAGIVLAVYSYSGIERVNCNEQTTAKRWLENKPEIVAAVSPCSCENY